jgi:hypothetical protein
MLYADVLLERRVLGLRAHRKIRETEEEIHRLARRKHHKAATALVCQLQAQWQPVLEMQAEAKAEGQVAARKGLERALIEKERNYAQMRAHKHEVGVATKVAAPLPASHVLAQRTRAV